MSDYMQGNPDKSTIVPFSDDSVESKETAELLDEKPAATAPEEHKTRWQKRQERLNGIIQTGKKAAEELEKERQEKAELKERLARLEGYAAAQAEQQRQKAANDVDPYQKRLDDIESRRKDAFAAYQAEVAAGKMNEERSKHYERIAREIDDSKVETLTERAIARRAPQQQQQDARRFWENQYPDVYRDERAFKYARGRWMMREAQGEQIGEDQIHEILQEARTKYSPVKHKPTASERDRFSGVPTGGTGGGASNDNGIVMTKEFKRMATALYPDMKEEEAFKKWANGPGKKLRAAKVV